MQKHARTSAERRRRNRFSFRSFLSASVIKIGGGFLSNVSFSSRRRSCCFCRDIDADTEEEKAEEEAIALDIGRDIFYRETRDDFQHLKHAPQNRKKVKFSSLLLSVLLFCSLFFAQTTNSLVKKKRIMIVSGRTIAPEPVQDILMSLEMTNETKKRLDTLQGWAKDLKVLLFR